MKPEASVTVPVVPAIVAPGLVAPAAMAQAPAVPALVPGGSAPVARRGAGATVRRALWSVFATLVSVACAAPLHAAPLARTLHPLAQQTTDEAIAADRALIGAWCARLDGLANANDDLWRMHAARAWLDVAGTEYADNDRTGFPQAAFARAVALIEEIERHAAPASYETVPTAIPPAGSMRVADSLYVALERMKRDLGFLCGAEELARLEIELAWAGNEQVDRGDCASAPHLATARDLARAAQRKVETCQPPLLAVRPTPVVLPAPIAPTDTVLVPKLVIPTVEELKIPRNVHFALDQFDITPASREVIARIAALLDKYPSITARLEGHTDSRGDTAYNLRLSRRRVMAARAVFVELGIDSTRLSIAYKGKSDLFAPEDSRRGFALNRRVEMVFVDSEGRDIEATRQEGDLQLESGRPAKHVAPSRVGSKHLTGAKKSGAKPSVRRSTPKRIRGGVRPSGKPRGAVKRRSR